jgi:methionyl-tRNA formyltransferase
MEILVVSGWNRLIGTDVLERFQFGALGVHAGHPPIGLGRAPLSWNIIKGYRDLEVYIFRLTASADDGDIMAIRTVQITAHDTVQTLYEKVMFCSAVMFQHSILALMSGQRGFAQASEFKVVYPKRTPADGLIDFRKSTEELVDFIRAQTRPYPGAFSFLNAVKWTIWSAQPFDTFAFRDMPRVPGRIVLALPTGLVVQTGSAPLWITCATTDTDIKVPSVLEKMEKYMGETFGPQQN